MEFEDDNGAATEAHFMQADIFSTLVAPTVRSSGVTAGGGLPVQHDMHMLEEIRVSGPPET